MNNKNKIIFTVLTPTTSNPLAARSVATNISASLFLYFSKASKR